MRDHTHKSPKMENKNEILVQTNPKQIRQDSFVTATFSVALVEVVEV